MGRREYKGCDFFLRGKVVTCVCVTKYNEQYFIILDL